jgi:hypothetical protein
MCEPCSTAHNRGVERRIYLSLILSVVAFVLIAIVISSYVGKMPDTQLPLSTIMVMSYYITSIYWGFKFLDRWRYSGLATVNMLAVGALMKLLLSVMVGPFVTPVAIVKMLLELKALKQTKRAVAQHQAR